MNYCCEVTFSTCRTPGLARWFSRKNEQLEVRCWSWINFDRIDLLQNLTENSTDSHCPMFSALIWTLRVTTRFIRMLCWIAILWLMLAIHSSLWFELILCFFILLSGLRLEKLRGDAGTARKFPDNQISSGMQYKHNSTLLAAARNDRHLLFSAVAHSGRLLSIIHSCWTSDQMLTLCCHSAWLTGGQANRCASYTQNCSPETR